MKKILILIAVLFSSIDSYAEEIVILGTNDLHGALLPTTAKTKDAEPAEYSIGGMSILGGYVDILKETYQGRFLFLDAGDQWQETLESNYNEGAAMVEAFNTLGLDAMAIGNHEFDYGPVGSNETGDPQGALKQRIMQAAFPFLSSNINILDGANRKQTIANLKPYKIFKFKQSGLKVGVLGITTNTTPVTTRAQFIRNVQFYKLRETVLTYASELRKQNDIVILLAHAGTRCKDSANDPLYETKTRTINDNGNDLCDPNEELYQLLTSLPKGFVDAVVAGHDHEIVHHWINNMPVIQSGKSGKYFHVLHMNYDKKNKKTTTTIEGPVPVCTNIFSNQKSCDGKLPAPVGGRGDMEPARYLGQIVQPNAQIETQLLKLNAELKTIKEKVIAHIGEPIPHERHIEGPMGNLAADALRWSIQADFSFINRGGIRGGFTNIGAVTFDDIYRVFPFDNYVSKINVTGKQLKQLLTIAENGDEGVFPVSGLQLIMNPVQNISEDELKAMQMDLNQDGKTDRWETDRNLEIFDIRSGTPQPLNDDQMYTIATLDFLVTGGDNMGWAFKQIPEKQMEITAAGSVRDEFIGYLNHLQSMNIPIEESVAGKLPRIMIRETISKQ